MCSVRFNSRLSGHFYGAGTSERLLKEKRSVGSKELHVYLEVQGYSEAAEWVYTQAVARPGDWTTSDVLSLAEVRNVHRLVVESAWMHFPPVGLVDGEGPGSWRRHDIRAFPGGMTPITWPLVDAEVSGWIGRVCAGPVDGQHVVEHLADMHAGFERVHPFRDGNGRTGRLLTNLLLVRHGFPPAVIYKRDRERYLRGLERADAGDLGGLSELLARAVRHSIDRFLLPKLAGDHRLIPLASLSGPNLGHAAIVAAVKRGRLKAVRQGDRWYSTKQWLAEYRASRYRRSADA